MSIINATIAAGTRRGLQSNLVWHNRRGQDIQRVLAMAAGGLLPTDAAGNVKLPDELLNALWRPMPGDNQNVNVTDLSGLVGDTSGGQPPAQAPSAQPPAQSPASNFPWAKAVTIAAALLGGGGLGSGIAAWLANRAAPAQLATPATPSYDETRYQLRLGKGAQ